MAAGAGRGAALAGAAPARGADGGAGGAAAVVKVGAGAADGPPVGPPGGSVGSLIVGAAEGFGGKLMRTVSFFGWTLPVSFFGGMAPAGTLGVLSAINVYKISLCFVPEGVNCIIGKNRRQECPALKRIIRSWRRT